MAGRSRRSSTELEPDLSTPSVPKKSRRFKTSSERLTVEHITDVESTDRPSTSETPLQEEAQEGEESSLSVIAEGTSEETSAISSSETLSRSIKQAVEVRAEPKPSEEEDTKARTSPEAIPGTSKQGEEEVAKPGTSKQGEQEEQIGILQSFVMKYSNLSELTRSAEKSSIGETGVQSFMLREHSLYEDLSLIGNGAYGTVYKARDRTSGQIVALKKVRVPLTEDGLPVSTLREIAALKSLERYEHPHIVRLLDVCQGDYLELVEPSDESERSERVNRGLTLWLVFEHVERDLASFIASYRNCTPRSNIPPELVRQMTKEIVCGVEFLHTHRIIHRDLKPQNLLVTRENRIKIADFGLARTYYFEMRLTSVVVTQWYRPPEVLLGCPYATPVDIWPIGCIVAELCTLEPLFPGTSEGDQLDRIFQVLGSPSKQAWPENVSLSWTAFPYRKPKPLGAILPDLNEHGLDLVRQMLRFDPNSRITAAQAAKHRYLTDDKE